MKTEPTEAQNLQVGDEVLGGDNTTWKVTEHVLPFNEGDTFMVVFKNVESGQELTRYLPRNQKFAVLTY
jgi:translation elongation factor P/translation initiation factor 5A